MAEKNEGIEACPWCKGAGRAVQTKDNSQYWYCECSKCFARQLAYSKDMGDAIDRWNARADR